MLLLIALENIFQYANLQKIYKIEYLKTNLNTGVLLLADARNVSSLQKKTEICSLRSPLFFITEKDRKNKPSATLTLTLTLTDSLALYFTLLCFTLLCLLALTYLLRQSLSLLCSLALAIFFITEKDRKDRKKQKFLPAAGEFNLNDNDNLNLNANVNYNLTGFNLNIFSIYEG